ncbi:hypothetical protein [Arthrobacter sp. CG_A4]|uniref:hypothetical protein n=1 Tax=Arthrobacter sp. CG_A4 TaxID=3071706 RepID=UPI002DFB8CE0|nr:hypothetical protein [Arthrobacter sp. CG_A4]
MVPTIDPQAASDEAQAAQLTARLQSWAHILDVGSPLRVESGYENAVATLRAFARRGIARDAAAVAEHAEPAAIVRALTSALNAIERSPLPEQEWPRMTALLGDDVLEGLVGASVSSMYRYRSGERHTPDHVAQRLHTLTLIAADLAGSYNDFGIRRWFARPRAQLDGRAPAEIMKGDWDPDDADVRRVKQLAAALTSPRSA